MREIKFRVWDKVTKKYISLEDYQDLGAIEVENDGTLTFSSRFRFKMNMMIMPDCFAVEQYTGLRDKNGREIYEADYLGDWCVYWASGQYILQNISTGDIMMCNEISIQGKEITGNRYENPREYKAMAPDL